MGAKRRAGEVSNDVINIDAVGNRVNTVVTLTNSGSDVVTVRSLEVGNQALRDASGQSLLRVPVLSRLRPGESQDCVVQFDLDGTMAPGNYEGEFRYPEMLRQPFLLRVMEHPRLTVLPQQLVLSGTPGELLKKEVIISNTGNTPVRIDKDIAVGLSEDNELNKVLTVSLGRSGDKGFTQFMDDVVSQFAADSVDPIAVKLARTDLDINPGETRELLASLRLPRNLKVHHYYIGLMSVYDKPVRVEVHVLRPQPGGDDTPTSKEE